MAKFLKALWVWLDGKKCLIATIYYSILVPGLPAIYPTGVPTKINAIMIIVGLIISTVGVGHKIAKAINSPDDNVDPPVETPATPVNNTPVA